MRLEPRPWFLDERSSIRWHPVLSVLMELKKSENNTIIKLSNIQKLYDLGKFDTPTNPFSSAFEREKYLKSLLFILISDNEL